MPSKRLEKIERETHPRVSVFTDRPLLLSNWKSCVIRQWLLTSGFLEVFIGDSNFNKLESLWLCLMKIGVCPFTRDCSIHQSAWRSELFAGNQQQYYISTDHLTGQLEDDGMTCFLVTNGVKLIYVWLWLRFLFHGKTATVFCQH